MRVTKLGHACVRIESDGVSLVIDPGTLTKHGACVDVDAVLITHEHLDHYDVDQLKASDAPIYTIAAVADQIRTTDPSIGERVTVVSPGETFDAAGIAIDAVGELHAVVHPDLPELFNCGYVVKGERVVYHPGDSFTFPSQQVDVLMAPVSGPWLKLGEVVDFARAVRARNVLAIHELGSSDIGLRMTDGRLEAMLDNHGSSYQRVAVGRDMIL